MIDNNIKEKDIGIYIIVIMSIICGLTNRMFLHLIFFIFLITLLISYIVQKREDKIIGLSIGVLPCLGLLTYNGIPFHNIFYMICLLAIICCNGKLYLSKKALLLYFCFIIIDMIKFFLFFGDLDFNIIIILNMFTLYLVMLYGIVVFYYIKKNANIYVTIIHNFIIGTGSSIIYGYLFRYFHYGLNNTFFSSNVGLRNTGASLDPNYFSFYIVLSISFIIVLYVLSKRKNLKYLIFVVLFVLAGFSSISRMYLVLCIPITLVFFIVCLKTFFSKHFYYVFIIGGFVLLSLFFYRSSIINNFDLIISRFNVDSTIDVSNGRFELFDIYTSIMNSNPKMMPFGVGISKYYKRLGVPLYAHNIYVELYVCLGFFGIFVLICYIVSSLFKLKITVNIVRFFPLLVSLIAGLAISFIDVEGFYIIFSLVFVTVSVLKNNQISEGI